MLYVCTLLLHHVVKALPVHLNRCFPINCSRKHMYWHSNSSVLNAACKFA